jgi:hypothetical protein
LTERRCNYLGRSPRSFALGVEKSAEVIVLRENEPYRKDKNGGLTTEEGRNIGTGLDSDRNQI